MTTYFKLRMPTNLGAIEAGSSVIIERVDDGVDDGLSFELRFDTIEDLLMHKELYPRGPSDIRSGKSIQENVERKVL